MASNLQEFDPVTDAAGDPGRTCADLIVDYLEQIGVEYIFGVPGGAIEPFFNALARKARRDPGRRPPLSAPRLLSRKSRRSGPGLQVIVARHESGAAFMADGYSRETGKLGVCCATTGPGTTNLITGVASAYADHIPLLVITAQTALPGFGSGALQESSSDAVDTVGMFAHCTRYNSLVSHPQQLERKLIKAMVTACQKPAGPSHISIPMDIQRAPLAAEAGTFDVATLFRQPEVADTHSFDALCQLLVKARRIVLLLGNDCRDSIKSIVQFAEVIGAAIVTTPAGKGCMNPYHYLYPGVFGFAGHSSARDTLLDDEVELVLAVGTGLDELSTNGWDETALLNNKLVHIDAALDSFVRSPMAQLHIYGHLRVIFSDLVQVFTSVDHQRESCFKGGQYSRARKATLQALSSWVVPNKRMTFGTPRKVALDEAEKCLSSDVPLKPQRLMFDLGRRFPEQTRFLSDAGNCWAWGTHYLHPKSSGCFRTGMGFGAMSWAIGAALGTALGNRGTPVVCLTGDGSFLMSGQELTVAVQQQLPVVFVILNDQALGMVKHGQRLGGGEAIGFELPPVDFAAVARAMGAQAWTIRTPEDFAALDIDAICNARLPTLLDVYIDPEEVPPMQARMKVLDEAADGQA